MLRPLLVITALALILAGVTLLVAAVGHLPGEPEADAQPQHSTGSTSTVPDVQPKHQGPPTTTTTVPPTTTTTAPPPPTEAPRPPAPAPAPPAPAPAGECSGWLDLVAAHFPPEQVGTACRVMACESGGSPTAENRTSSASGLFQFLSGTWRSTTGLAPPASAYAPAIQVEAAATLWRSSGWSPWVCA